ncbi:Protein FAM89A [Halotydeus destructor]|nr:Protein FAM89A [Halotydeus destructor]
MEKLPPPPKSLTVANELAGMTDHKTEEVVSETVSQPKQSQSQFGYGCSNRLDGQLMTLKKEMASLRQLDLSLLSQLNALRQSITEYKSLLNEGQNQEAGDMLASVLQAAAINDNGEDTVSDDEADLSSSTSRSQSM